MSTGGTLPLRDVHLPPFPPLWPLPLGWWLVLGTVAVVLAGWWAWRERGRRRRARWLSLFDARLAEADGPVAEVAAIAELLRRAARQRQRGAELLDGTEWLAFLDPPGSRAFSDGAGRLLLDGMYRAQVDPAQVGQLRALARARFLDLMVRT
ncbi:DUF4381 family protein [Stenotrophomonas sp. LGBM10]|uniref:DUF4381 family protein n=1 Tax=Stenotrophomonas sp. LGBM10 TaxID=3390038 RepID=UPI00398B9608